MYEHEVESDEDCEVYFLKPVNEYNIVDKIKEANKELFALDDDATTGNGNTSDNGNGRKVTFAANLENYEPTEAQSRDKEEVDGEQSSLLQELSQLKLKTEHFTPIIEEDTNVEEISKISEPEPQSQFESKPFVVAANEPLEEEEICEEILDIVDMESPIKQQKTIETPIEDVDFSSVDEDDLYDAPEEQSETHSKSVMQRHMDRQDTFDLDGESDNKSLTNLLTESDCEEEERTLNEARLKLRQAYQNLYKTLDATEQAKIQALTSAPALTDDNTIINEDEDDDLSIIVASYIPENFELNKRSIFYKNDTEDVPLDDSTKGNVKTIIKSTTTTSKNFFGASRFSLRRRTKPTPTQISEIKLNYKTCCEHRQSLERQDKLPQYTGYLSEYGLSAQQLQRREQQVRRQQRFVLEQTLNRSEQDLKKMQDNERAFTTWLKNKMRYPINKTRNMFDAKIRRGSVAAAAPNSSRSEQRHSRIDRRDSGEVHAYGHLLGHWNK